MRIALRLNLDGSISDPLSETEMSPGMQRIYNRILRRFSARGTTGAKKIVPKLSARVCVNGCEFSDAKQMPPEYRRFYEEILSSALPVQRAVDIVARTEHSNFIKRTITLAFIAAVCVAAIFYLWSRGYYG